MARRGRLLRRGIRSGQPHVEEGRATVLASYRLANALALTHPHRGRRLGRKEPRNSPHSGTHLRQTGGFFVPARLQAQPT